MDALIRRMRAMAPSREQLEANPWLAGLAPRLADPKLWHWSRRSVALGVAIGLFIALAIPLAQILLAAAAAVFLRANVPIAAVATLATNPLTVPPIYFGAYQLGAWVIGDASPAPVSFANPAGLWENLAAIGPPLFAGLGIAATVCALTSYLLVSRLWARRVAAKRRETRPRGTAR